MRYLMQFRTPVHARLFDEKHPGIIAPQPGVTDYVVDTEPPPFGPVIVTPVQPVPEG